MKQFFAPDSVAVVGASANPMAIGGQPIRQLLRHGFQGKIYPVNPKRDVIQDLPCYSSVADLPEAVDVALIAVAAPHAAGVIEQCGKRGIPYAAVLSSGFADAGGEGVELQRQLLDCARRNGVRMLGPNCVGYVSMAAPLYAGFGAFFEYDFAPGSVSFVTQSGGVGGSLLTVLDEQGVNFRHFLHTGNAADIDIETLLDAFVDDPGTRVLLSYIEGLAEDSRFPQVAERALRAGKPLIAWKAGKSPASGSAVVSHTGRMAGDIERYRAVFEHYGVIEVEDSIDLGDVLRLCQFDCVPKGTRVGVVSVSGGAGVIAADCLENSERLELAGFSAETEARIGDVLPGFATNRNPIDITAQIFNEPDLFEKVVKLLCEQDEVDVIVACVASVHGAVGERIAEAIKQTQQTVDVPIVAVWASRHELNDAAFDLLDVARIPLFRAPERALKALDRVSALSAARARLDEPTAAAKGKGIEDSTRDWSRTTEVEVLEELAQHGMVIPRQRLVHSEEEATQALQAIGAPVVMKIQSPDIAHKAKVGGVRLNVRDHGAAAEAYQALMAAGAAVDGAEVRGVAVQEMAPAGVEVICGYVKDPVLGDFLLFGGGGDNVEAEKDIRLVSMPASAGDLRRAVSRARVGRQLAEVSGGLEEGCEVLATLQSFVLAQDGALRELEVNPVIITAQGARAVDALAIADVKEANHQSEETVTS